MSNKPPLNVYFYNREQLSRRRRISSKIYLPPQFSHHTSFAMFSALSELITGNYSVEEFQNDGKFIDSSFPPTKKSIFGNLKNHRNNLKWVRAEDLTSSNKIYKKITAEDIQQGRIGNCWFLAALSSLSENPNNITKLFSSEKINKNGKYTVNLFKNGVLKKIEIDSLIPYNIIESKPFGTASKSNQIWVLLLEKAYAKMHGSYMSLSKGECHEGFMDLSCCPSGVLPKNLRDQALFDEILRHSENDDLYLTAAIDSKEKGHGSSAMTHLGLLTDHAYSVLQAKLEKNANGETVRLVQLRNPWSKFEWNGDYSDGSKKWTKNMKKDCQLCVDDKDGVFWMDFEHFNSLFDTFSYCDMTKNWEIESESFQMKLPNTHSFPQSQFFTVTVPENKTLDYVGIHQVNERYQQAPHYLDLSAFIVQPKKSFFSDSKCIAVLDSEIAQWSQKKLQLAQGTYHIFPYTSGVQMNAEKHPDLRHLTLLLHFSDKNDFPNKICHSNTKNDSFKTFNISSDCLHSNLSSDLSYNVSSNLSSEKSYNEISKLSHENKTNNLNKLNQYPEQILNKSFNESSDQSLNKSSKESLKKAKITKIEYNPNLIKTAKKSLLKKAKLAKEIDGLFALKWVTVGGLIIFGIEISNKIKDRVKYSVDVSKCKNLKPSLDSWQKQKIQELVKGPKDSGKTKVLGSFVRQDNEKCHFSVDVFCETAL